jgi:hypothetical protein
MMQPVILQDTIRIPMALNIALAVIFILIAVGYVGGFWWLLLGAREQNP